jgi:hypothetical protein
MQWFQHLEKLNMTRLCNSLCILIYSCVTLRNYKTVKGILWGGRTPINTWRIHMLSSLSQVWCKWCRWWLWKSHVCTYATHGVDIEFNSNIFTKEHVSFVGQDDLGQLQLLEYKRSLKMQVFIIILFLKKMQLMIID